LLVPYRWRDNVALGNRLTKLRETLLANQSVDLRSPPFQWRRLPTGGPDQQIAAQLAACEHLHGQAGSVVAIRRWANECYAVAGRLGGRYTCMEEMDCKDLLRAATTIEEGQGVERCQAIFDFADLCMIGLATPLRTIRQHVGSGRVPDLRRLQGHQNIAAAVARVAASRGLEPVQPFLRMLNEVPGRRIFRRELWREMDRALNVYLTGRGKSLRDAAWELRNRLRRQGRGIEKRTISRTLLIKGLEFDHTVVLDAAEHDAKNFYVAATRPTDSLTICSASPTIRFEQ
jgi:hypothetical protein